MSSLFNVNAQFWASLIDSPLKILVHILDIAIVSWLIYKFIKALAGTKVMSLVQGVVLFVLFKFVAEFLGFTTIAFLMNQVITYGVIAGVVIFAPEIRSGLERFGRTPQSFIQRQQLSDDEKLVAAFVKAVAYMSPRKIGALVSIEETQTLREYIATGIPLDADISGELLINIFIPNTPLHDGAVIVEGNKIAVSCAYLPLSESSHISKEFGTRHRADFQKLLMPLPLLFPRKQELFLLLTKVILSMICPLKLLRSYCGSISLKKNQRKRIG